MSAPLYLQTPCLHPSIYRPFLFRARALSSVGGETTKRGTTKRGTRTRDTRTRGTRQQEHKAFSLKNEKPLFFHLCTLLFGPKDGFT